MFLLGSLFGFAYILGVFILSNLPKYFTGPPPLKYTVSLFFFTIKDQSRVVP